MRIIFATTTFGPTYGGQDISTKLLLTELKKAGHQVIVLTLKSTLSPSKDIITLDYLGLIPEKILAPGNSLTDHFISIRLAEAMAVLKPEIIHVQDQFFLPAVILANKGTNVPCIYSCHNTVLSHQNGKQPLKDRIVSMTFNRRNKSSVGALRKVDAIISVSDYIRNELIQLGISGKKINTIYNIPPTVICPLHVEKDCKRPLHLFCAGRLVTEKGFDVAIEAMKIILEKEPSTKLTISGNGPQFNAIKNLVITGGLTKSIDLVGWVTQQELFRLYGEADIVLLPSVYPEPFGRGSLDAMLFGKPIIASNVGGIPEAVLNGINGILVPAGNAQAMAKAVLYLNDNIAVCKRMGDAGRQILKQKFNTEQIVNKTIALYNDTINKK